MDAVQECFGDVKHWEQFADDLVKEFNARGLMVVEVPCPSHVLEMLSKANMADR